MINHWSLVVLGGCVLLLGCGRSREFSKSQEEKVKSQIEALAAESKHDTSTASSRVRSVCPYCGAWKESAPTNILASRMEGAAPGSTEAKEIAAAKKTEAPFFVRHLEQCGRKGGIIKAVYPD